MEDSPDAGTEVTEVTLICPVIWFMLLKPPVLVAMDTLMFMLLLYMLVFACCPKCGGDCCENMLEHREKVSEPGGKPRQQSGALVLEWTNLNGVNTGPVGLRCWDRNMKLFPCIRYWEDSHRPTFPAPRCPLCLLWSQILIKLALDHCLPQGVQQLKGNQLTGIAFNFEARGAMLGFCKILLIFAKE